MKALIEKSRLIQYCKNFIAFFVGCILAFIMFELFLRIYNPFEFRVKGTKIVLPINRKYRIKNNSIKKLEKNISHKRNSLGFRGEEPPEDFKDRLTIIAVGGSTTECFYLSENKDWPSILGMKLKQNFPELWINNAGLDGHSTYGHIILMKNHIAKLKPKIVLFLVGLNDVMLENFNRCDQTIYSDANPKYFPAIGSEKIKLMADYSEVFALVLNLRRYFKARAMNITHREINLRTTRNNFQMDAKTEKTIKRICKEKFLKIYQAKLMKLISISIKNGIKPVFILQPALFGNSTDDITNVNLANIYISARGIEQNGKFMWEILELYNDVTRQVAKKENLLVIDLAKELPKSSRYYYDFVHYTNEGAEKVAEIIYKHLRTFLENYKKRGK